MLFCSLRLTNCIWESRAFHLKTFSIHITSCSTSLQLTCKYYLGLMDQDFMPSLSMFSFLASPQSNLAPNGPVYDLLPPHGLWRSPIESRSYVCVRHALPLCHPHLQAGLWLWRIHAGHHRVGDMKAIITLFLDFDFLFNSFFFSLYWFFSTLHCSAI